MDAKTINTGLKKVYENYAKYMYASEGRYPVLMQCKPAYAKEGNTRILFVIREDLEEWYNAPAESFDNNNIVETATKAYKNFKFSSPYDFWLDIMDTISSGVNSKGYLWTKYIPFGYYNKETCPVKQYDCSYVAMDMLKEEIEICNPHAIVFISGFGGATDVNLIKHIIGRQVLFMPVRENPALSVVVGKKAIDIPMFRFSVSEYFKNFELLSENLIKVMRENVKVEEYSY